MSVALITGGSAGLGRALVVALVERGWTVVTDARHEAPLAELAVTITGPGTLVPIPGDVADGDHRAALVAAVDAAGGLDLLVHNASTLGPTPLRPLAELTVEDLPPVWRTNVGAPMALTGDLLDRLVRSGGVLVGLSSDAAVEPYDGWGLYGASKAALDHLVLTYGAENPAIAAYAVDPGDMRTQMHQDAFPDEDISDRPEPETVVPRLLTLLDRRPPNGRYRAADVAVAVSA